MADTPDPVTALAALGAVWSPDFDSYAAGTIPLSQVRCVLCRTAPCSCPRCPAHQMSTHTCGCTTPGAA
jgi:hypothetical protein